MGHVPVSISIRTDPQNKQKALEATEGAYQVAEKIESKISEYQSTSEISCLNQKAGKNYCKLSPETLGLLRAALEIMDKTDQAFDIRFASLSEKARKAPLLLLVDEAKLSNTETRIGLASLGKGYILDQMVDFLQSKGFETVLVDAGGDLKAGNGKWKVAIQVPGAAYGKNTPSFLLSHQALTTSANYENSKNIIDPRSLKPVLRHSSVSVFAKEAALANALSTALYVLGEEKSAEILAQFPNIKIIWTYPDGKFKIFP